MPGLTYTFDLMTDEISVHDLLAVFSQCQLITKNINFGEIEPEDSAALAALLSRYERDISLKDFVLERSKTCSQSLDYILKNLNLESIENIRKNDLLTNLLHAHLTTHKEKFDVYDIATVILQYMTIQRFKSLCAEGMSTLTLSTIDFFSENCPTAQSLNTAVLNEFEGLLHFSKLSNIKPSNYSQLNQVLLITNRMYYLPDASRSIGAAFYDDQKLYVIPFGIMLQIYQGLSNTNCKRIMPAPVIGCFNFEMFEDLAFKRKNRYRPVTIPSYLGTIRTLFYGVTGGKNNPSYDNASGFKDMQIAHGRKCGYIGVLMHDLFHLSYNVKHAKMMGIMSIESELFPAIRKMLQDERFKDEHEFIESKLFELMDTEFVCAASLETLKDPAKLPELLSALRLQHNNIELIRQIIEQNVRDLSILPDSEYLNFQYYRRIFDSISRDKVQSLGLRI